MTVAVTPRVSIGLPVYNGEEYVADSIESLLGQTFEDFELIISDNASTDSTLEICREYARKDPRIRLVEQKANLGLAANHNMVFDLARAEYFKWAAADDLYGRDLLQCCVDALDRHPDVVLAHAYEGVVDHIGNVTQAMPYPLATDSPRASDRFRSFLFGSSGMFDNDDPSAPGLVRVDYEGILSFCDQYGVVRRSALREAGPHASFHHPDRIIVCGLALRGKFHITPQWLYFRRDNSDRSYNVASLRTRCEIMDPRRKNRVLHPTARLVAEYLYGYVRAIRQAPIEQAEKRACFRHLGRWAADRTTGKFVSRDMVPTVDRLAASDQRHRVSARAVVAGWEPAT
jgi:glycosyltransferase involved in cell wall biosynthesis